MSMFTKIIKIESEFDDVYRITTEDGIIVDIPEKITPKIGQQIEYYGTDSKFPATRLSDFTIMYGNQMNTILDDENYIIVSFGGLLGKFPKNLFIDDLIFYYRIVW